MEPIYWPLAILGCLVIASLGVSTLFGWVLVLAWCSWLAIILNTDVKK